jgi:hypothetical protein
MSKAIPAHLKPKTAENNGDAAEFQRRHHGKTQSHVVCTIFPSTKRGVVFPLSSAESHDELDGAGRSSRLLSSKLRSDDQRNYNGGAATLLQPPDIVRTKGADHGFRRSPSLLSGRRTATKCNGHSRHMVVQAGRIPQGRSCPLPGHMISRRLRYPSGAKITTS